MEKQGSVLVNRISEVRELGRLASAAKVGSAKTPDAKKKRRIVKTAMSLKSSAMGGYDMGLGGGGFGGGYIMGSATNIYSPQLSTDFLELPQDLAEKRSYFRHFYNKDPFVGQAIDLHTELPLSKIRLTLPEGKDPARNRKILRFFEDMVERLNLLQVLLEATREYYVIGEAFIFAEDTPLEIPESVKYETVPHIDHTGKVQHKTYPRPNAKELEEEYRKRHYEGWSKLIVLPPDQVKISSYQFSELGRLELIADGKTKNVVQRATQGDLTALEEVKLIPQDIRDLLMEDRNIPLGTNPHEGSFAYHLARSKSSYSDHGVSLLERCMNTLVYRDKLRQSQTSIASRAMTPKRVIYAEDLDEYDVDELRDQVDAALLDPDYSIIANYEVHWNEVSANDRLLNLSSEYDHSNRELFAGLGVTESMLTGESSYSGERINIEIINNRYLLYRELIQRYVEEFLFKPVAIKKGFFEYDEFGSKRVLYPRLSFTRLAVRDNRDTFDALFNLYQKGSLSVDFILELFNLDPGAVRERLEKDLFTVNDSTFNEAIRSIMSDSGRELVERSNMVELLADYLAKVSQYKVKYQEPSENTGRF